MDNQNICLDNKVVRSDDLVYVCHDIFNKLNNRIMVMQPIEDKRSRIQNTGRLVWIADRFVDIDFSTLKNAIPYVKDGDHLMIIRDETHDGQCSIYSIYNTESVPNIRYLGYGEPATYPSCSAVEQHVAHSVAMTDLNIRNAMEDLTQSFDAKIESLSDENARLKATVENLTNLVISLESKIRDVDARVESVHTNLSTDINNEATRANDAETAISRNVAANAEKIAACEAEIEALKKNQ